MNTNWHDLGTALALYLVLEGVVPFLSPGAAKRAFATMAGAPAHRLRALGFASMLAGCACLYFIRG
jgi:uncharacterized protein YjeT (DUF2065 family)